MCANEGGNSPGLFDRSFIQEQIKVETAVQVKDQMRVQIKDHLPVTLEEQVEGSKLQLMEVRQALMNSYVASSRWSSTADEV